MKAERQQKEPQQADPVQSKREKTKLSFVDNRSHVATQAKLIDLIQRKDSKIEFPNDLKIDTRAFYPQRCKAFMTDYMMMLKPPIFVQNHLS